MCSRAINKRLPVRNDRKTSVQYTNEGDPVQQLPKENYKMKYEIRVRGEWLMYENKTVRWAHDLRNSGRGDKLKAALIRWQIRVLILEIMVWTVGRLDSKVPRFRAARRSLKVSLMWNELSSFE